MESSQTPPTPYRFSNEELRTLQECNRESFFQRSLPLSTMLGFSTYFGVKNGYIGGSAKYGAVPKVVIAVIGGYILGKISYQRKCVEKIMALPDSKLGAMFRERMKGTKNPDALTMEPEVGNLIGDVPQTETYSDHPPKQTHMDFDTERPNKDIMDDIFRPSLDDNRLEEDSNVGTPAPPSHVTSYDELRRQNRESYEANRSRPYQRRAVEDSPRIIERKLEPPPPTQRPGSTNMYGDIWDK